jgi:hypothetical protein
MKVSVTTGRVYKITFYNRLIISEEVDFFSLHPDAEQIERDTSCHHPPLKTANFAVYPSHP